MTVNGDYDSGNDRSASNSFLERASGRLAAIRNGILIYDQDRSAAADLRVSLGSLNNLRSDAAVAGRSDLIELVDACDREMRVLLSDDAPPAAVGRTLDAVARTEEALLRLPLSSDEFLEDVSELVDTSFGSLRIDSPPSDGADELIDFEIDDETLDIFRSEAAELLNNIDGNITKLRVDPGDREALWEVRRNAHTFKGAAGIVGLRGASTLAHRVEDMLDRMVELDADAEESVITLLASAAKRLEVAALGTQFTEESGTLDDLYRQFEVAMENMALPTPPRASASGLPATSRPVDPPSALRSRSTPIVRVSLDRLDDLISLTHTLAESRALLEQQMASAGSLGPAGEFLRDMLPLLDAQDRLTEEIHQKLARIRMVRFGTLETRLARAVHVTCEEENKNAVLKIENGDIEIDTQVLDALVEPLLHLLKNAVVHGIEDPETRRLIRKPDKGEISVEIRCDETGVTVRVSDDGGGISTERLKQKAVDRAVINREAADYMAPSQVFGLIFERGLTTAERLNLNAGRGIGMSIVKQSVESHGGRITVESEPQVGTTFTIEMPLSLKRTDASGPVENGAPTTNASKQALVLVVDDSAIVRRQTSRLVESAGHRVITAENGAEAVELLLSNALRPDLILSDIEMPVMDGWELLECVKGSKELAAIPVVMVSSLAAIEFIKKAFLLGALDYKVKPLSAPDFSAIISAVQSRANASGPAAYSA